MKKFTLLMGAALMALTASAADTLYLVGNKVNGSQNWDPTNPVVLTAADGVFTFKAEGEFTISTKKAGWDAGWKTEAYCLDGSWNIDSAAGTATANLKQNYTNIQSPKANEEVTYTVSQDLKTISAKFSTAATVNKIYLVGPFSNWASNKENYPFVQSETNADEYTYTWDGDFDSAFKVLANGAWLGTTSAIVSGTEYSLSDIGEVDTKLAGTAKNPVFTFNVKTNKLVVTYSAGEEQEVKYGYMIHASWVPGSEAWNREALTKGEDGVWSITQTVPANGEFGVKVVKDDAVDESSWITTLSKDSENCSGGNGSNIKITKAGTYVISFVPNATNGDEGVVTVKEQTSTRVATIEAANTEAVYFNMQGVRVANPENGLFIRVQNGKAVKVVK